jgi:hypothetical protein
VNPLVDQNDFGKVDGYLRMMVGVCVRRCSSATKTPAAGVARFVVVVTKGRAAW